MNKTDPKKPPSIVIISLEAKFVLYNCIDATTKNIKVNDNRNDEFVDTAFQIKNNILNEFNLKYLTIFTHFFCI